MTSRTTRPWYEDYASEATFEAPDYALRADFHRSFRTVSGRSSGSVDVTHGHAEPTVLRDDVRLYQPAEVRHLLERAERRPASAHEHVGADHGGNNSPRTRAWPGPFNLRAFIGQCAADDRRVFEHEIAADHARFHAIAMAPSQAIDGNTPAGLVVERAALDSGLVVEHVLAHRVLDAMMSAGWAAHGPPSANGAVPVT